MTFATSRPTVFTITIGQDPYVYFRSTKRCFLWMDVKQSRYTITAPGEYIFIDRHFNTFCMTEAQMNACIASDFKSWRRPEAKPLTKDDEDFDDAE